MRTSLVTLGALPGVGSGQGGRAFAAHLVGSCRQRMGLQPERAGSDGWINASVFPPCGFITTAMDLAMMSGTAAR
jgi:hypothetical protein